MDILGKRRTFIVISPRDGQIREYGFSPRALGLILLGVLGFVGVVVITPTHRAFINRAIKKPCWPCRKKTKTSCTA